MTELPPIDWELAAKMGARFAPRAIRTTRDERREAVVSLQHLGAEAHAHAVEVTGLPDPGTPVDIEVCGRSRWIELNTQTARRLLGAVASVPERASWGLLQKAQARFLSAEIAPALGWISAKIIGQFDPFAAKPTLLLVAPNVLQIERELGVVPRDFRLWVAVHEQTHRLQFHAATWLPNRMGELLRMVVGSGSVTVSGKQPETVRPRSLVDLVSSPAQRAAIDDVTALMSVLEGYAEVMMSRVGQKTIPTVEEIRSKFQRRRTRGGIDAVMRRVLGMDAKLAQYRDGHAFCSYVLEAAGLASLNRVFASPVAMPSYEELRNPRLWLRRMG